MEGFPFRPRPLSLLIGFLLLPGIRRTRCSPTMPRNPAKEITPHDLNPQDENFWGTDATLISNDGNTILGYSCIATAPGSNGCSTSALV